MPVPKQASAGSIRYRIGFVPNPGRRGGHPGLFSEELLAAIRRRNAPEEKVVYFDGRRSRTEEVNADYGVRSRSFELRIAGGATVTYCKEFPDFGFCVEHPVSLPPGGPPPHLTPAGDMVTIAGLRCRRAKYQGDRHLFTWYTDEVALNDPTGAVFSLEGVPGLILQTEEISGSDTIDAVRRLTVVELNFEAPPPEIFSVPANYRRFADVDAARAENRRILDEKSAEELRDHPLSAGEREMFVGRWLFEAPKDKIQVEIFPTGENEFRFVTTVLTAAENVAGRISREKASMKGRLLMVEEPPNYRLYRLENEGQTLAQVGDGLFTFTRC